MVQGPDVAWVIVQDFLARALCLQGQVLGLDADSGSEEALAEDLEEAVDGDKLVSAISLDIPINQGCPTGIPMECPMDILMEWDMNLSILHQELPLEADRKNRREEKAFLQDQLTQIKKRLGELEKQNKEKK